MSVDAIFACKLYRASKHKDKIRAAMQNPLNSELVIQLNEYLDDDVVPDKDIKPSKSTDKRKEDKKDEKIRPSEHSSGGSGGFSSPSFSDDFDSGEGMDHHLSDKMAEAEAAEFKESNESTESESLEEASKINGQPIKASTQEYVSKEVDAISGLLNSREDTNGVCRVVVKRTPEDGELWIHYNDTVNLNNVMEPVIAVLNASNYAMLNFNRLARTENAIVFSISESLKHVEPLEEVDEQK